ncbi:PEST proteolytic signal-containing nuclear protein [Frankliniella fusca]|uniref:PEST proteolytic signal-containing nuclear protein n=1 Tax=Frankliniella fusca TaxID=407009 RepID=A0AAE1L9G9_9NEOP|nr:PEST proteolytic signal-containing nuclear protein [Frankliniella fusca]
MSKRSSYDRERQGRRSKGYSSSDSDGSVSDVDDDRSPPKKTKLAFGLSKKPSVPKPVEGPSSKTITMKLGLQKPSTDKPAPSLKAPSRTVAAAFNVDDDDEVEEMPPEARMRMRNIGRDTPTSAGPNSFGKTKQGFCDAKKVFEKTLKKKMEEV